MGSMKTELPEIRPEERTPLVQALLEVIRQLTDRGAGLEETSRHVCDEHVVLLETNRQLTDRAAQLDETNRHVCGENAVLLETNRQLMDRVAKLERPMENCGMRSPC